MSKVPIRFFFAIQFGMLQGYIQDSFKDQKCLYYFGINPIESLSELFLRKIKFWFS